MKKVLLVEPAYKAKYPPLGLMKISTFHKLRGDDVTFYKGTNAAIRDQKWDIIYITTLFTFQWKTTIETIKYYQSGKRHGKKNIKVGGILATLLGRELEFETGISPHSGLWLEVDNLTPDYSLLRNGDYPTLNASIGYMTKGCTNRCKFCAVHTLEPEFIHYVPLKPQIDAARKDLILLDNNVLASNEFNRIIEDIKTNGFTKGAIFNKGIRRVDFNQGVDARLLTEDKMHLLSSIPISPLRIAFDDIHLADTYVECIKLANKYGIRKLSNYILFNYEDTPDDFYQRLLINIELNEMLGLSIFSFPMRYVPLDARDRKYVSAKWTQKQLRGVQCILHATHGVVGPRRPFFEKAFGKNEAEFRHIIEQPEEVIFDRTKMPPLLC